METIKAKDLRIGNKAYYKFWNPEPNNEHWAYSEVTIVGVLKDTFYFTSRNDNRVSKIGELYAIPITEERLIQLGFEHKSFGEFLPKSWYELKYLSNGHDDYLTSWVSVLINIESFSCVICDEYPDEIGANTKQRIQYVHQLQNLYYALTGEELTLTNNNKEE